MVSRNFIFSEKKSDRIERHLLFWFCYGLYFTFFHAIQNTKPEISYFHNIPFTTWEAFHLLVPQILFTYILIDFILPRFILKNKYILSFFWIIFFWCATGVLSFILLNYVFAGLTVNILPEKFMYHPNPARYLMLARIVTVKGTVMVATAACSIRLFKYWHLKEKRNLELLKEKTEAQLQLLTAQVHPHFLFNTLNNIYSKAQNESPGSAKMIMELSHILRHVLDEGKHELVPLENELQMLKGYIYLEKMSYDDKFDLHLSLPSKTEDVYITPLLLLPFVENCFKHRTSKMLKNPWVNLKIELTDTLLFMKLMSGKETNVGVNSDNEDTGIENVKKRLELLYKDKYDLQINEDGEVFVVNLAMQLVKINQSALPQIETITAATYA
jgi:sensor histidine kinase YesM